MNGDQVISEEVRRALAQEAVQKLFTWARHEGIRQRQLAFLLRVHESLITRWKNGDRLPGPRTLPRILELLHEEVRNEEGNGKTARQAREGTAGRERNLGTVT